MGRLEYAGHAVIHFADHSYRWIHLKRFSRQGDGPYDDALAELIGSPQYRDHYLSPDSHEHDAGSVHGPYRLDAIYPACFQPISSSEAGEAVRAFCRLDPGPPAAEVLDRVETLVLSPIRDAACYRLRDIPDARHETGWILRDFRELVGIHHDAGQVVLVVMASD